MNADIQTILALSKENNTRVSVTFEPSGEMVIWAEKDTWTTYKKFDNLSCADSDYMPPLAHFVAGVIDELNDSLRSDEL